MLIHKLSIAILFLIGVLLAGLLIVRFMITRSITCSPACVGMNLTDRDLHGIDLHKVRLMEAQLQSADLRDANLREADLSGANLMRANLRNADLTDARLIGTDLSGARLEGAILKGADLSGANLSEADLTNVDLHTTLLGGANFVKAKLTNVQLQGANLSGLNFSEASMAGANLERTLLFGAALSRADLSGATLVLADLTGAWLNLANLVGANLTNADLGGSSLIGAELASTNLQGSNLAGAILVGAQLFGANLRSANLRDARTLLTQLPQRTLQLDPLLQELNELQRQSILQDAQLDGIAFDSRTIWPDGAMIAAADSRSPLPPTLQSTDDLTATRAASTLTASGTQAGSTTDGLPVAKRVAVSFFINSIRNIDPQQGRFKGDLYIDLYWHEPGLAANQEISALAPESRWNPRLLLVNSQNGHFLFDFYSKSNEPESNVRFSTRAIGDFSADFNLRDFPFDQQALTIKFEPSSGNSDAVLLEFIDLNQRQVPSERPYVQAIPKGRYVDSQAVNNEWTVSDTGIAQQLYVYQSDQSSYSRFQIELTLARRSAPYVWKYMLPLVLVALFAWSTLLVDGANVVARFRLLALLLLTIAGIHIVLWETLPATAYLTYLDRFLLLHYAILVALIALVFTIYYLQKRGVRGAQWANRGLLFSYPLCYVGINLLLYWQLGS